MSNYINVEIRVRNSKTRWGLDKLFYAAPNKMGPITPQHPWADELIPPLIEMIQKAYDEEQQK